ncbi:sigma-70 family RNA polymerase sigma factor [Spirosoma sp. SC4-14]|uniref:sigma-70 family RNA polymerase sigma factor n=1 Tax=Spirosoma sp. SC4-14 TaxID=3128900 RepID=UPI0030D446BD
MNSSDSIDAYRSTLVAVAYRMTGEVMVSEDIVQDVLLNWMNRSGNVVLEPKAYLIKSVMNAALNHLAQAKRQREAYKGMWLPEPVSTEQRRIDASLDISYGLMLLLEKLSPMERAVFVLKESFDVSYTDIAQAFAITEANGRQLYRRAREKMASINRRFVLNPQQQQELLTVFSEASQTGDLERLIQWFKTDVVLYSDGGGKVPTAIKPLVGRETVAIYLRALATKWQGKLSFKPMLINGQLALLSTYTDSGILHTVMVFELDTDGINTIYSVRNPDKLAYLQ